MPATTSTVVPVVYEQHMHTPLCKHAVGDPGEYAFIAQRRGLKGIVVTCHNPIPDGYAPRVRMFPNEFSKYVDLVARDRKEWAGKIDIRLGIESDYAPGMEGYLERFHQSAEFHHVLGSVHPQIGEYQTKYYTGDAFAFQKTYFTHLAMAAETKLFDTLSHPDLVKNCHPSKWDLDRVLSHICACLDRIAKAGTAMELNTSGLHKDIEEMNPGPRILKEIQARGIPIVVGADAHVPNRVAADFEEAYDLLTEAGFTHVNIFLDRKRQSIPIAAAKTSLKPL